MGNLAVAHYNVGWACFSRALLTRYGNFPESNTRQNTQNAPQQPLQQRNPARKPTLSLDDPSLFINRELSLLDFQRRVLEEAQDSSNPPLDRVMFLSFVGSNVDEFFMVRVAGLKRQIEKGVMDSGPDAMTPAEQLRAIRASVIRLNRAAHECWAKEMVPTLREPDCASKTSPTSRKSSRRLRTLIFRTPSSPR